MRSPDSDLILTGSVLHHPGVVLRLPGLLEPLGHIGQVRRVIDPPPGLVPLGVLRAIVVPHASMAHAGQVQQALLVRQIDPDAAAPAPSVLVQ